MGSRGDALAEDVESASQPLLHLMAFLNRNPAGSEKGNCKGKKVKKNRESASKELFLLQSCILLMVLFWTSAQFCASVEAYN
jgi:hypothetical protein